MKSRSTEAGFTLIEMLVVMAILALVVTIAAPRFSSRPGAVRLQMAIAELSSALKATRSAAIAHNAETTLVVDVDGRSFKSSVLPPRGFASDIEAKLRFASAIRSSQSDGGFRFFPDGSSTGGDVTLSLQGHSATICVDWLTGNVREQQAC